MKNLECTSRIFSGPASDPNDPKYSEDPLAYEIEVREGLCKETPTLMSKYERRGTADNLDKISYAQFCKEYDPPQKE